MNDYQNPLFVDTMGELLDDTSLAMQLAYSGMVENGHAYLIRSCLLLDKNDAITRANYRSVLTNYEKRWKIWKQ